MKIEKGKGQYDIEYMSSPCAWGREPAKFVKKVINYINNGKALDLGAGEGKNSIYLVKNRFSVTAIDVSVHAIRNFIDWVIEEKLDDEITIIRGDVLKFEFSDKFDLIVAYGLLHALRTKDEINAAIKKMHDLTLPGGINVVCTFTDDLPVPPAQGYLEPTFLKSDELIKTYYSDWEIIDFENGIISETHPSCDEEHEHSLCRLIARKPS